MSGTLTKSGWLRFFGRHLRNNRGVALVTVLAVSTALAMVGGSFLDTTGHDAGVVNEKVRRQQAFWAAETGCEYAKRELKILSNWTSGTQTWSMDLPTIDGITPTAVVEFDNFDPVTKQATLVSIVNFGGYTETINLTVKANYTTSQPYSAAACGCNGFTFSGNSLVNSYDGTLGPYDSNTATDFGDVGSGGDITMAGNATIKGDIIATGHITTDGNVIATQDVVCGGDLTIKGSSVYQQDASAVGDTDMLGTAEIQGSLEAGGNLTGTVNNNIFGSATLGGNADAWNGTVAGGITTGGSTPDAPPEPCDCDAFDVAQLATDAASSNDNTSCSAISGTVLQLSGKSTATLTTGTYYLTEFQISGQAKVIIDGDVEIILDGSGPFNFTGKGIVNSTDRTQYLSIFSNSTSDIKLAGNNQFAGTIFAPNALVQRSGNAELFGSILGGTASMSGNAGLHFDVSLASIGGGEQAGGDEIPVSVETVSWQHVSSSSNSGYSETTTNTN